MLVHRSSQASYWLMHEVSTAVGSALALNRYIKWAAEPHVVTRPACCTAMATAIFTPHIQHELPLSHGTKCVSCGAGGCFWGLELAYQRVPGVTKTSVGYTAGNDKSPTYNSVCSGSTGHAEAVQVLLALTVGSCTRNCAA